MKKIMALLLTIVLALTMTACGGGRTGGDSTGGSQSPKSSDAPAQETDTSLADAKEIVIGAAITQTGGQSAVGVESQRGFEIAVNEINEAGGIAGKQIRTIIYDDQATPEASLKAVTRLVEQDQVHAIFGPMSSNSMMAVGEYLNDAETVSYTHLTLPTIGG